MAVFLKEGRGQVGRYIFLGLIFFFGAFSRYPLQSFVPNPGTKGFSLLSGLGSVTDPICLWREQDLNFTPETAVYATFIYVLNLCAPILHPNSILLFQY